MSERESVKVVVRCRPFSEKEKSGGHTCIVQINKELATVQIQSQNQTEPSKSFTFDSVFDWTCKQSDVYNTTARPIVDSVLEDGQTGTGKTFSMEGIRNVPELRGIIPNAFDHIFSHINLSSASTQYLVRASYLEIYNEDILDLLNPNAGKLELKERADVGVYVKDLRTFVVRDGDEMDRLMEFGNKNRSVGATEMNARSSRSHSIFTITVEASQVSDVTDGDPKIRAGKLHLVDLAGSERQSKTGATGDRLKEATKINLSLSALGNVISALVDGKSSHIPYRDSKLTRLLQDSLGGNAKTLMIATLSPASYNFDESVSTLRYANRAKNIKNKPKINEDPKDAMLREFQEEIKRLKTQLEAEEQGGTIVEGPDGQKVQVIEEVEEIEEIEEETDNESEPESKSHKKRAGRRKSRPHGGIPEERLIEMAEEVAREKQAILQSKDLEESEKNKLLDQVEQRAKELELEREARDTLQQKLSQLQQKLLVGGVSLVDKEAQIQLEMAKKASELEEGKRKERELQRELEEHEEQNLQIEEEYVSLQEEKEAKTRKIKKLWNMLVQNRSEIKDLREEHQREREDLLDTIRDLTRELKLKIVSINSYVPDQALSLIEENAEYDDVAEKWKIMNISHAGNNITGKRSLVSGKIMGMSRETESDAEDAHGIWDALAIFPDPFLTYDIGDLKKKKGQSKSAKKRSNTSARNSPTKNRGNKSRNGKGMVGEVEPSAEYLDDEQNDDSAPSARGLVSKGHRYA